ncbi:MAG: nitrite reductase (NAD(P)H) small subunit, partial [Gorillibacterium sp.]|nr:nitrite reductase (NAD(P)H) small subunit [Gorillibacterium sp.]
VELAIFRLKTGEIRIIENECPQGGGKLSDGIVCDRFVFSPIHDYKINLDDGRVDSPDSGQLRVYSAEVDRLSGMLVVLVEESVEAIKHPSLETVKPQRIEWAS